LGARPVLLDTCFGPGRLATRRLDPPCSRPRQLTLTTGHAARTVATSSIPLDDLSRRKHAFERVRNECLLPAGVRQSGRDQELEAAQRICLMVQFAPCFSSWIVCVLSDSVRRAPDFGTTSWLIRATTVAMV
jgi:hypothetical protein